MLHIRACSHCVARVFHHSTFAHGAMQRFFSSAASSSSARAERPGTSTAPNSPDKGERLSAERPVTSTTHSAQLSITTIRDVQRWLAEDHVASCTGADAQCIREAVAVLSPPEPRQRDVRPLQASGGWHEKKTKESYRYRR